METIKAYIALTKPRVIELLLVAAIPAMLQADRGIPTLTEVWLILATLFGGWMGAGAANTFNMVADYDIDQKMGRTRARPLVRAKITKGKATVFAWVLLVASVLWLWLVCNSWLASVFILLTNWFYIYVYTKWLKRRTWQNVIWGGAAGCMPVLVGWAVIRDNVSDGTPDQWWQAVVLFMIIFFWTPPHTWALAMKYRDDYAKAEVPMLPVIASPVKTTQQILIYSWLTVITSLLLIPATSWIYVVIALLSGAAFLIMATQLHNGVKAGENVKPLKLFILSNNYLAILFIGLSIDAVLGWTTVSEMLGWNLTLF
ncbi:heme o synthase [Corynebacterium cystitidis]|uniref:Protoheme IX farnesyltransferase n=1 Tax=Corynebacterium cystitidis DSM 20524 TaxID=1121357 RepID=A0A1H9PJ62_9CORY|nr:heme o synthase [Corynebacterium cystitidis]WJY82473.1 Protoheme IX farnesyltransferase [Corynebacterium cystitidis DSM 20524]SER48281.1 protoheme IX farnesyltransferase [Corynebacterium cystitidis DSM 20524]SNV75321.1 protoheme IX farnesyltransferase [Corynebacterium cystitidis]